MAELDPSPQTTLLILLGASSWPHHTELPSSTAFENAVRGLRAYFLSDPNGFHLPRRNVLDLFNSDELGPALLNRISNFLKEHQESRVGVRDILVYFVGHGGIPGDSTTFYLAIRQTEKDYEKGTSITIENLAERLKKGARFQRRILILDCCFAAKAIKFFQGPAPTVLLKEKMFAAFEENDRGKGFPSRGTSFLGSSGKDAASIILPDETSTTFTSALLSALHAGDTHQEGDRLSLRSVYRLTIDNLYKTSRDAFPLPEIHSPDQIEGDVADVPFFPNPPVLEEHLRIAEEARRRQTEQAKWIRQIEEEKLRATASTPIAFPPKVVPSVAQSSIQIAPPSTQIKNSVVGGSSSHRITMLSHFTRRKVLFGLGITAVVATSSSLVWGFLPHPLLIYRGHSGSVQAVAWSPDGMRIASGAGDKTVQVWNAADGGNVLTYRGHSDGVLTVAWSPDGKRIASGGFDKTIQVWNAADGGDVLTYHASDRVNAIAWSPNGARIASASIDGVQIWNATNGENILTYRGHSNMDVLTVAWSPNGIRIASGGFDNTVQVWNAADERNIFIYSGKSGGVYALAWSPSGIRIASGNDNGTVQVWNAADGGNVLTYRGHYGDRSVYVVAWSPDGKYIASASPDTIVQVWNPVDGSGVYTYRGHTSSVATAAWSPNSRFIASGSVDETVQVWSAR